MGSETSFPWNGQEVDVREALVFKGSKVGGGVDDVSGGCHRNLPGESVMSVLQIWTAQTHKCNKRKRRNGGGGGTANRSLTHSRARASLNH